MSEQVGFPLSLSVTPAALRLLRCSLRPTNKAQNEAGAHTGNESSAGVGKGKLVWAPACSPPS